MIITTVVLLISLTPFLWWFLLLRKYKCLEKIPGPKPTPIVGSALEMGSSPQEFLKVVSSFQKEYGDIFKIYIANELRIVITNAKMMENVLSSNVHITKSNAYDLIKPWLGSGLLISTGKKWKTRRKMITPTFHFKILDQFVETFNSCGNTLIAKLSKEGIGKQSIDVYPFINLYSLDVICETSMGVKIKAQQGQNNDYVLAVRDFLEIFITRSFSSWKRIDAFFRLSSSYSDFKKHLKTLHNFTINVIKKRRLDKSQSTEDIDDSNEGIKKRVALLDTLLNCEETNTLSNDDIREEIDTFMFEGHDTTTSGIAFAILALAQHQKIQEKVYEEVIAITGNDKNANITMQQLQDVKYLEMVIKEVQRMYPSVPTVERVLETDWEIDGYKFPKGVFLTLFIYGMHHSEMYYPNPEQFDPERFLPENQATRHNYAYVPFSAGPRNCIGQKFAILTMKTIISKIVKNFRILPVPDFKPDLGMAAILKSYNGICVRLERRQ